MNTLKAERDIQIHSGEKQLKEFGRFIDSHDEKLQELIDDDVNIENYFQHVSPTCSLDYAPVSIKYDSKRENISVFDLIDSDNKVLNKIIIVFGHLCEEMRLLRAEASVLQLTVMYHDEDISEATQDPSDHSDLVKISQHLKLLFDIKHFLERCSVVAYNVLQQLVALFEEEKCFINIQSSIHFQSVFNYLGDLFVNLIEFDEILPATNLLRAWILYKKSIGNLINNSDPQFQTFDQKSLRQLSGVLNDLQGLFSGNAFQNALDACSKIKLNISATALGIFGGHFQAYLRSTFGEISKYGTDLSELNETREIVKINATTVVYHHLFGNLDQRRFKQLVDVNTKYVGITLIGNIVWCPEPFLKKHAETMLKGFDKYVLEASKARQVYLTTKSQSLVRDVQSYCIQITAWILRVNQFVKDKRIDLKLEHLKQRCNVFLEGIQFAGQISNMIKTITNLHVLLKTPMQKSCLTALCKLIEFLKLIRTTFDKNAECIIETIFSVSQYLEYQTLVIIASTKKKIAQESTYNERNLDILSALQISERCMYGPATPQRILVARLGLSAADPSVIFSTDYLQKLVKILTRLELISDLQANIDKICDSSFLYWHQSLFPIYLKHVVDSNTNVQRISYVINSASACKEVVDAISTDRFQCMETFNKTISDELKANVLQNICQQIETLLRLDVHSNLHLEKSNPFDKKSTSGDLRALIQLKPISLGDRHIIVKDYVEHYLGAMFYNLTTVSLHDWKTYGEMRQLATAKYKLFTVEDHLPPQTLEQGLDVLEIMRNIHVFVAKYLYNLNNQIFIEQISNNKHLNTINIRHIANSLRTHGTGIMNTTVNFTYQFLQKKFYIFSQFMFDEHIKSRLLKDLKYFRENKQKLNQMYGYDRADSFNKGIRKLGLSPTGQSYLDLFRTLVTQIGNAMGYIRMMRSGAIHACYNASVYLPFLDTQLPFKEFATSENLSQNVRNAAENLEMHIRNLTQNCAEGTEYFKLLVDAFAPFFRNEKHVHLRNFYLIVPPLTINFVEYILAAKDQMSKKNKQNALFTDDGFAMGLAYILKLLGQTSDFNSLHWFKSVRVSFARQINKINEQKANVANSGDDKLQQTLALTEKRITTFQQEFDLLYCNLSSAKIFFQ